MPMTLCAVLVARFFKLRIWLNFSTTVKSCNKCLYAHIFCECCFNDTKHLLEGKWHGKESNFKSIYPCSKNPCLSSNAQSFLNPKPWHGRLCKPCVLQLRCVNSWFLGIFQTSTKSTCSELKRAQWNLLNYSNAQGRMQWFFNISIFGCLRHWASSLAGKYHAPQKPCITYKTTTKTTVSSVPALSCTPSGTTRRNSHTHHQITAVAVLGVVEKLVALDIYQGKSQMNK